MSEPQSTDAAAIPEKREESIRQRHTQYFEDLASGKMELLARNFTFPAVFKGFIEDVVLVNDAESLVSTYSDLIKAAPRAARTDVQGTDVAYIRPGIYTLTMRYQQFDANDGLIHEGRAVYFLKDIEGDYRIFAVM